MRINLKLINYWLSKQISRISSKFIWWTLGIIATSVILIPWLGKIPCLSGIGRFFVDIFTPVSFRNLGYNADSGYSWFSSIAYAIGVIIITGLFVSLVTTYLRTLGESYKSGTLDQYSWHGHILFLGYDELMIGTLKRTCSMGKQVVVAVPENVPWVRNKIKRSLTESEFKWVEVILCNKTDKEDLRRKACVDHATHLFIVGQPDDATHDASNFKSLDAIAAIVGEETDLACYIYIRNRASLSLVQRQGFDSKDDSKLRRITNPFNFYENMVGKLLCGVDCENTLMTLDYHSSKRNLAMCPRANVHLVILGMTEVGMALAREVLMVAHYPNHRVRITLVDEKAREEMFYFCGRYKELFKYCNLSYEDLDNTSVSPYPPQTANTLFDVDFHFIQASIAHPLLMERLETWSKDENQLMTLAVCTADSPRNMATALYMPRTILENKTPTPIWVYQQGDDSLREFTNHELFKNIHTFSTDEYGSVNILGSPEIKWAEEVAMAYEKSKTGGLRAKPWNEMTQYERWSSLYNVRSFFMKIRAMGYEVCNEKGGMALHYFGDGDLSRQKQMDFSERQILELAATEHTRWIVDTLIKGFRPTTEEEHQQVEQDPTNKEKYKKELFAHDDIRPYADLPPDTAAYDKDMTEAMIKAINRQLRDGA